MRLASFAGTSGVVRLGAVTDKGLIDLRTAARNLGIPADAFADMISFLTAGESAASEAQRLIADAPQGSVAAMSGIRLLPPVPKPGKIIAIGLNYRDHQIESGAKEAPKSPMIFAKFTSSIAAAEDSIVIPVGDPQVDYEAELGVVIGRRGKGISEENALSYVAGYMPLNDVSARSWQFADKQWVRGKSCDTFCPTGPYLTTRDEIPDPHALFIRARVNGETLQDSNTSKMIFKVPQLIAHISASITLEPGDVIATGTPEGVGVFRNPPIFLKAGDVVEIEIEGLGILRNPVVSA
ncbi:MAG TPA: fumarylacetoacetate hydrolase family protein [Candidatus Saccharimonadales bacterium]|nr:fumarylacetoacetate hydrolase family protein [Candidatus Saccharimonadales bacterium]